MDPVMRKTALSAVERYIIEEMLSAEYGPASGFSRQLAVARVDKRRLTGVGIFVDLSVPQTAARIDGVNAELSADYRTTLPAPADLVGFTLFIRAGVVSFLEGYTHGDVAWPEGLMEDWLIVAAAEPQHQKVK